MEKIYLTDVKADIKRVYCTDEFVYNKNDILENRELFIETKYIFSTWGMPVFSEEEIKRIFPNLKAVFYGAGTVQNFARPFLNCGVKVFSAWAANAVPVAEYTVAQIVLANKGFFKTMRYTKRDHANMKLVNYLGNYDATVGIIGVGMIGSIVAEMLKKYNLKVLAFDPFLSDEKAVKLGVEKCSLEDIFSNCNVISNHLANNERTKGILNIDLFKRMLPYSTFLNTGRGAQVVESDLIRVLKERPDLTAILDVTEPEPPQKDSDLYVLENCILTPHIAGSTGNEVRRMGEYMIREYENLKNSKPCKYEVTIEMLETMA